MTRTLAVDITIPSPQTVAQMAPPIDEVERERLMARAARLLAERDAVLVAHYYTDPDLQILADRTGGHVADSLEMARFGAAQRAATLVVAGVRFMGETAKILNPEKRVLVPEPEANCSLDLGCPPEDFARFRAEHPERTVVVYANTSAAVKAQADWMVTSGIALDVVRELLEEAQVRMLGPRTMLGDAMGLGMNLFERSEVEERVMIVLTDGNDTGSLVPPERAAEIARDQGVTVHTVAIGDPTAAGEQALDEATLRAVAQTTGGRYFHAEDREAMSAVYTELDALNPKQVETVSYRPRRELYHWPLAAVMLATLGFFALARGAARTARPSAQDAVEPA